MRACTALPLCEGTCLPCVSMHDMTGACKRGGLVADASMWHVRDGRRGNMGAPVPDRHGHGCTTASRAAASTMTDSLKRIAEQPDLVHLEPKLRIILAGFPEDAAAEQLSDTPKCLVNII